MFPTSDSSTSSLYILPPSYNPLIELPNSGGFSPRGIPVPSADRCACRERAGVPTNGRGRPAEGSVSPGSRRGGTSEGGLVADGTQQGHDSQTVVASSARKSLFAWLHLPWPWCRKWATGPPRRVKDGSRWGAVPELENPAHTESHHPATGRDLSQPTES